MGVCFRACVLCEYGRHINGEMCVCVCVCVCACGKLMARAALRTACVGRGRKTDSTQEKKNRTARVGRGRETESAQEKQSVLFQLAYEGLGSSV